MREAARAAAAEHQSGRDTAQATRNPQLPSQLGPGLLAQRRLTNRFKLKFPS
jgi:hypothetical protein